MQINSIVPQPKNETSVGGWRSSRSSRCRRGGRQDYFIGFQVDPTTLGRQRQIRQPARRRDEAPDRRPHAHGAALVDIGLRAAFAFGFIFLLTRVVGRRELTSLEPFDLVLLIVVGDLVQQGITQSDYSLTGLVIAVSTMALLTVLVSWLSYRFPRLRPVLDGEPIVIVRDGEPIERNLKRERRDTRRSRGRGTPPADRLAQEVQVGRPRDDGAHQLSRGEG